MGAFVPMNQLFSVVAERLYDGSRVASALGLNCFLRHVVTPDHVIHNQSWVLASEIETSAKSLIFSANKLGSFVL